MGAIDTQYTFTATDTITSAKMNNIIDQTTITASAISGTTLDVTTAGQLKIRSQGITSSEMGENSVKTIAIENLNVTTGKLADSSVTTAKIASGSITTDKLAANIAGNGPAFRAYVATGISIIPIGATPTKIDLNGVTNNPNTSFDVTNKRFQPTVAGYYQIQGQVSIAYNSFSSNVYIYVYIYKNGAEHSVAANSSFNNTSLVGVANVSDLIYLNGSTDYVELYARHGNTSNAVIPTNGTNGSYTFMSGFLARSA